MISAGFENNIIIVMFSFEILFLVFLIIRYDNETYFENKIPVVIFSTNVSGYDIAYLIQGKKVQ